MSKKLLLLYAEDDKLVAAVNEEFKTTVKKEFDLHKDNIVEIAELAKGSELVLCPGGCIKPLAAGVYTLCESAVKDAVSDEYGTSVYDLVMKVAFDVSKKLAATVYFTDAMSTDELLPLNRVRSNNTIPKYSRGYRAEHMAALTKVLGNGRIEDGNYIVAYIDDYVSVGAYERGYCLEINDCIGGEGPFGFTSAGDVPCAQIANYFVKSDKSYEEMYEMLTKESGLKAYLGITSPKELDEKCKEDEKAREIADSMVYQLCKSIGMSTCTLKGKVDKLVITGKGAYSTYLTEALTKKMEKMFPVTVVCDYAMDEYLGKKANMIGTYAFPIKSY